MICIALQNCGTALQNCDTATHIVKLVLASDIQFIVVLEY